MIDYKPIEKERINEYKSYYDYTGGLGCELNFVNGYLWNQEYRLRVAVYRDTLIKAYFRDEHRVWGYCMPSGAYVAEAVEAVFADAEERGQRVYFAYMTGRERDLLEALFPGRFVYDREPANQDYIYNTGDLATLAGKKYHAKRNHISKFYRIYGDDVRFETLCAHNLADAMQVMTDWCTENGYDPQSYGEMEVFREACRCFDELGLHGGILYVGSKPVATTMGCAISDVCFDVMFEKGLRAYDGVYAVINHEFAKTLTRYAYINREEDLGIEGLRKSKLSYHPAIIYDRYCAKPL